MVAPLAKSAHASAPHAAPPPPSQGTYRVAVAYCDLCRKRTLSPTVETIRLDGGRWGAAYRCANCSMLNVLAPHGDVPAGVPCVEIPHPQPRAAGQAQQEVRVRRGHRR